MELPRSCIRSGKNGWLKVKLCAQTVDLVLRVFFDGLWNRSLDSADQKILGRVFHIDKFQKLRSVSLCDQIIGADSVGHQGSGSLLNDSVMGQKREGAAPESDG